MYRQRRVGVVIPAFNEADKIAAAIAAVPHFVERIVVVDDASTDATCERVAEAERSVILVSHPVNRGVGAAIVTGYRALLETPVDVAVVMAGDGQMDPADLPALLDPIVEGRADYSKGNRFRHRELLVQMPAIRVVGNTLLSLATKFTSGYRHVFDSQCGYTAVTRQTLKRLALDDIFPRYGYPNDMLAHLWRVDARVVDVPVRPVYGPTWDSGITWHTAIYPVGFVLLKSWWNRARRERDVGRQEDHQAQVVSLRAAE